MHAEWLRKVGCCLTHQIWNISEGGLGINGTSVSVFILFVVRPVLIRKCQGDAVHLQRSAADSANEGI